MHRAPRHNFKRTRAFTAFEALIAATILAFLTAAVGGALAAGRQQTKTARDTLYASMLAKAMMDEVCRLPAGTQTTFGPGTLTRASFTTANNYDGYSDGPTNITDLGGNAFTDVYQPFVRKVTVTVAPAAPSSWGQPITGVLVTVTVGRNNITIITLQRAVYN